jgi:hypothetical protein
MPLVALYTKARFSRILQVKRHLWILHRHAEVSFAGSKSVSVVSDKRVDPANPRTHRTQTSTLAGTGRLCERAKYSIYG